MHIVELFWQESLLGAHALASMLIWQNYCKEARHISQSKQPAI
jgi:hypothetical protein